MSWSQLARDCRLYCRMSDPKLQGKLTSSTYTSWSKEMILGLLAPFHTPDILIVIICEYIYLNKPILHCNSLTYTIKTVEMLTYMAKHHWNLNLCSLIDFIREWLYLLRMINQKLKSRGAQLRVLSLQTRCIPPRTTQTFQAFSYIFWYHIHIN